MTHVLVVEDEKSDSETLSCLLRDDRFVVSVASTGPEALAWLQASRADLVLLDTALPEMSGNEVCMQLRRTSDVPIIMVGEQADEIDKVVGLEIGADDFLTKPYAPRELLARIRAVLRRRWEHLELPPRVLEAGPVVVDLDRHAVTVRGNLVAVPMREFQLLELLVRNKGRVLTRKLILDRVWGIHHVGDGKTLDVHIRRLRHKIEKVPSYPEHIVTVRGVGYRFDPNEAANGGVGTRERARAADPG